MNNDGSRYGRMEAISLQCRAFGAITVRVTSYNDEHLFWLRCYYHLRNRRIVTDGFAERYMRDGMLQRSLCPLDKTVMLSASDEHCDYEVTNRGIISPGGLLSWDSIQRQVVGRYIPSVLDSSKLCVGRWMYPTNREELEFWMVWSTSLADAVIFHESSRLAEDSLAVIIREKTFTPVFCSGGTFQPSVLKLEQILKGVISHVIELKPSTRIINPS